MKEEGLRKTDNNKIFIGKQIEIDADKFVAEIEKMRGICETNDKQAVVDQLKVLVPTFHHDTVYFELMKKKEEEYREEYEEDCKEREKREEVQREEARQDDAKDKPDADEGKAADAEDGENLEKSGDRPRQ